MPHYPRRISNIKRKRKFGFRAKMKTKQGRKTINRKRRVGRHRLSGVGRRPPLDELTAMDRPPIPRGYFLRLPDFHAAVRTRPMDTVADGSLLR